MKSNRIIFCTVIALTLLQFVCIEGLGADKLSEFQPVDPNRIPEILTMISNRTRSNYEKIKSWQGTISFNDIIVSRGSNAAKRLKRNADIEVAQEPNELMASYVGTTVFKIDLENNRFYKYINRPEPVEYVDVQKKLIYTASTGPYEKTKIVTEEYEIESYPNRWDKNQAVLNRIGKKRLTSKGMKTHVNSGGSDPRSFYNIGKPVWVLLSQLSQSSKNKIEGIEIYGIILEKGKTEEDKVIYRVKMTKPGENQTYLTFVLKEEAGFNPTYIEYRNDDGRVEGEINTDFIEVEGIYLPYKRREVQYDPSDGRLRRDANWTLNNMQVNINFAENTFTEQNCGLEDGDKFIDEIENKEYRYKEATESLELVNEN